MLSQIWDLEVFFPGGSSSQAFQEELRAIADSQSILKKHLEEGKDLKEAIERLQSIQIALREAGAFTGCLYAQNVNDKKAVALSGSFQELDAKYETLVAQLCEKLVQMDDASFKQFLEAPGLKEIAFPIAEKRRQMKEKLSLPSESIINDLAVDGYHGWLEMHQALVGKTTIPFEENGLKVELSVSQADNKLDHPDRDVRRQVFHNALEAWKRQEDVFAQVINHLSGFRLKLYEKRGWKNVLKEPLDLNRMTEKTLNAMWTAINKYKPILANYLALKANLLGIEKLSWFDLEAPLGKDESYIPYEKAAEIIIKEFKNVSEDMSDFARMAFEQRWIEAEDRPGKRPGGFCTDFPKTGQTRIFMTYSGTPTNLSTLAHELGHAYHSYVMRNLPAFNQEYRMNVAETASTFAEQVVFDSLLEQAAESEKLTLLDNKIGRSVAFLMNIHARFLYETRFYEERRNGLLSSDKISQLMVDAQKEAYLDALGEWNPCFWISKGHFYFTGVPFYNFPYTFGYLLSLGIYSKRHQNDFGANYKALLMDTGTMTSEELVKKHLKADLETTDFWEEALEIVAKECKAFEKIAKS